MNVCRKVWKKGEGNRSTGEEEERKTEEEVNGLCESRSQIEITVGGGKEQPNEIEANVIVQSPQIKSGTTMKRKTKVIQRTSTVSQQ